MRFCIRPLTAAIGLACASIALGGQAFAQDADTPQLGEVVVKGERIQDVPGAQAVAADTIQSLAASTSDTASLLRNVPGVSMFSGGGVSGLPVIHGMADDRNRIKVDGMDLLASCPNHMNSPLSYLDPSALGELQVFTGVTPVSVGGDSIGGTIIANSKAPEFAAPGAKLLAKGELGSFYRSNGDAYGANVAATLASENLSLTYTGNMATANDYLAGGNFKTATATGRPGQSLGLNKVGSTAYQTWNQTIGLAARLDNHLIEAQYGYQNVPYELYPNQRMDMLGNREDRYSLRYLGQYDWGSLEAKVYHEDVNHHMDFGDDKQYLYGVAKGMPMDTRSRTTGARLKAEIDLTPQDLLRLGTEYQSYRLNDSWAPSGGTMMAPNTFWNINNGQRDRLAVFSEWQSQWNPQWQSLLGLRVEQVKTDAGTVQGYNSSASYSLPAAAFNAQDRQRTDYNFDWTGLVKYTPDVHQNYEFGYARKTRSPNLYERYSWSKNSMAMVMNNFVGDGNGYVGNPDLKPEVAHTVSATGNWHDEERQWELQASPYYSHVTDYIDAMRCGSVSGGTSLCGGTANNTATNKFVQLQYANQTARLYGLDVSARMPLGHSVAGAFGLQGVLTYTKGKNLDTGSSLYNIMPLNGKLTLTHQLGGWNNALELVMVDAKNDVSTARQEIKTPGYSLVNLRGSYSWNAVRVDFGVENLLDKLYYLPQGGAYVGQGTTMSTNGIPWGIVVPGQGRSLYASLKIKF